ncbi:hypothetical protein [Thiolapillus sp.]|uniref:hypothetical protein n=4 Tax=Thiolapillus sp. TaxID=2017437 RepID=UPI0025D4C4F2|nr:hypothetical protein [Thiolapillus sp.]
MNKIKILAAALVLASGQLLASGVATVSTGDGKSKVQMSIEYDAGHTRMNMPMESQQGSGYMLFRDGKVWMVANVQGQTMVMDVARMRAGHPATGGAALQQEFISARPTGQKARVAGFSGEVYELTWKETGQTRSDKVVLSEDPVVVEYSNAWLGMAEGMAAAMGHKMKNSISGYLRKEGLGMLKMGDSFEVVSIKPGKVDARRFNLPKSTFQMPSMPR